MWLPGLNREATDVDAATDVGVQGFVQASLSQYLGL